MTKEDFKKPNITINRVYTKKGDSGETYLIGGHKIDKDSLRVSAFGEVDELNAYVGNCVFLMGNDIFNDIKSDLIVIQHELFNLGNMIATNPHDSMDGMPQISQKSITFLEDKIDLYNKNLPSLDSFVLPGGSDLNVKLHISRTVCRRCERLVVELSKSEKVDPLILAYLNRLSDLFFVLSRLSNLMLKQKESMWNPNYRE